MSDFQSGGIANPQGESQRRALLRETLEEKYVSLMAHIEVFNDVRRTDNFLNVPPKRGDQLPQRFLFPAGGGQRRGGQPALGPLRRRWIPIAVVASSKTGSSTTESATTGRPRSFRYPRCIPSETLVFRRGHST